MTSCLPPLFHEILEAPLSPLLEQAIDEGRRVIGYTCSYVPDALIGVEGLQPVRVRAPGVAGTPMADTYLSSVICSYTRSMLELVLEGAYSHLDGWVFTASCDHLRRLFDNLEYLDRPAFNHILDLPHKLGDEALDWFVEELQALAQRLAAAFDVDTGPEAVAAAIDRENEYRGLLRRIGELRKQDAPAISGADFLRLLVAGGAAPKDRLLPELAALADRLAAMTGPGTHRARLMLVGSQLDDPDYVELIESVGGLVVADRFCLGSLPGLQPIADGPDPLRALAAHVLRKTSCPRMMEEFDSRVEQILAAAREYRADGIVLQTMKFCDTWGVESSPLVPALRDSGIPVLRLEREYALSGEGQLRTRVQAFLESLGR